MDDTEAWAGSPLVWLLLCHWCRLPDGIVLNRQADLRRDEVPSRCPCLVIGSLLQLRSLMACRIVDSSKRSWRSREELKEAHDRRLHGVDSGALCYLNGVRFVAGVLSVCLSVEVKLRSHRV